MPRVKMLQLAGWGNFPVENCNAFRPESGSELSAALADPQVPSVISRGLGRGYGDSALNSDGGVILHQHLNRFISLDPSTGILECEAGVSLAEILDIIVPKGFFLPVTPGTKFVTIGGAIAADVHGKNHHRDGSISEFLLDFKLMLPSGQIITCSPTENIEEFSATVGGMGLTGAIVSARLRLVPVQSAFITVDYKRAANIDAALDMFASGDDAYPYSVAWIDCLATGSSMGRSVLMRGSHANVADLSAEYRDAPLNLPPKRKHSVPLFMPGFLLNSLSIRMFNSHFYRKNKDARRVVDYDSFFYPLDGVLHWNRLYGKRGFLQYQAVIPLEASRRGLIKMLDALTTTRAASFLAVLKTMGQSSRGLLSFGMPGHSLALDIPYHGPQTVELAHQLDQIVLEHGGRVYLAKDACMERSTFSAMYPKLPEFQRIQQRLDPDRRLASSQSRRLGITA
jgi:decaprenylphospho-beta-D-ribofuranose 2-oxidase